MQTRNQTASSRPLNLTEFQDQAHVAATAHRTHRKGSGLGFGGNGRQLSGLPPKMRKQRRHNLRIAGWTRRAESMPAPEVAPHVAADPELSAPQPGKTTSVAAKLSRFLGRFLGRKGGR